MSEEKPVKKVIDWELIERHYRAGIKTVRQLAIEYGVSHTAIQKRAKRDVWPRSAKANAGKVVIGKTDEMESAGFLYVIYIDSGLERIYKVGMAKRFDARFDQHQCASPFDICVAVCYFTGNMRAEERFLHKEYKDSRVRGEWFRLSDDDLKSIAKRALLV